MDRVRKIIADGRSQISSAALKRHQEAQNREFERSAIAKNMATVIDLCSGVHNYGLSYFDVEKPPRGTLARLFWHQLSIGEGVSRACVSRDTFAALAQLRQLYEAHVFFHFIALHPEASTRFEDHSVIAEYELNKAFEIVQSGSALEVQRNQLIEKHGEQFSRQYGWASGVSGFDKAPRLVDLAKAIGIEHYKNLYKLTSDAVHSSAYFVYVDPDIDGVLPQIGFAMTEMLVLTASGFLESIGASEVELVILSSLLKDLRDEIQELGLQGRTNG